MASSGGNGTGRLQPWARPFVALLVAAFLACGILGIEAWPLSGFRLFSAPRSSVSTGWRLVAITSDGSEEPVNVSRLGSAYRGFGFVARSFEDLPTADRNAVCRVWLRAARSIGIEAVGLRLVRVEQSLVPRDADGPLREPRTIVVETCDRGSA